MAELSFVFRKYRATREHISIFRGGQLVLDEALPDTPRCDARCERFVRPRDPSRGGESIRLRDLDADGELETIVDLWMGGANCCTRTIVYGFQGATGIYDHVAETWGTGYGLRRLGSDGRLQFVGADERWEYAFACGACSPVPIRIWQYDGGHIEVVTSDYPQVVARDARDHFRRYLHVRAHPSRLWRGTTRAVLAAWVVDQCLLEQCRAALRFVQRALRRGDLQRFHRYDSGPFGQAYVRKLDLMLRRFGYR